MRAKSSITMPYHRTAGRHLVQMPRFTKAHSKFQSADYLDLIEDDLTLIHSLVWNPEEDAAPCKLSSASSSAQSQ